MKVRMAIMSHLSDAQEVISFDKVQAIKEINFAKKLLLRYSDTSIEVSEKELNDIWDSLSQ